MNALPTEIQLHILSFLPGKDVVRFKQLNSFYEDIIAKNRIYLSYPRFTVHLQCCNNKLIIWFCNWKYETNLNEQSLSKVEQYRPPNPVDNTSSFGCFKVFRRKKKTPVVRPPTIYCPFFGQFFKRDIPDHNLQALFEFILEKCDIEKLDLTQLQGRKCISSLTEAVKRSLSRIRCVETKDSPDLYDLLIAIANMKKASTSKTKMRLMGLCSKTPEGFIRMNWSQNLNIISSLYDLTLVETGENYHTDIPQFITFIAEKWRVEGYPQINFGLQVHGPHHFFSPWRIDRKNLEELFEISFEGGMKPLRLKDKKTENVIEFSKHISKTFCQEFKSSMPTIYISIDVFHNC